VGRPSLASSASRLRATSLALLHFIRVADGQDARLSPFDVAQNPAFRTCRARPQAETRKYSIPNARVFPTLRACDISIAKVPPMIWRGSAAQGSGDSLASRLRGNFGPKPLVRY
jgi:hypothetical protein